MFYELCHNRQVTKNPCYICHIVFPFCSIPNCFLQQIHGRLIIEWIPYSFYCPLRIIKKTTKIKLFWHNDAEVFAFEFSSIEILYAPVSFYSKHCRHNHHNNRLSTSVLWESRCHDRVIVDKPRLCDMIYFLRNRIMEDILDILGGVSIRKTVLPGMAIPMLKIRRPNGRLIFNMEIAIRR